MLTTALFSYVHFIAAFALVAAVLYERITISEHLTLKDAVRIRKADAIYGISALIVLVAGFIRVFLFEKGSTYYFGNIYFHVKLGAFILVGLASIYPSIRFVKWKKEIRQGSPPAPDKKEFRRIRLLLNIEIAGLIIIILSASLMAKGLGI